jgi:hypothetical protein
VVSLEEKNLMELPDGNKFYVIIDRLSCHGDNYLVCDYKTSTTLPTAQEAVNDRQLAMYALWVRMNHPEAGRVVQQWHMLHFDKVVEVEHSKEELMSCRSEVVERIAEIEGCSDFPPSCSKLCDYCEYRDICPEFAPAKGGDHSPVAVETPDLDKLVDELHSINERLECMTRRKKDIEQQLLQYSDRSGAREIFGSKAVASIVPYEGVKMPEHYTEFLIEHGLLAKYGCVSSSRVRSAVLKGTADPLILNTVRRTTEMRVRGHCPILRIPSMKVYFTERILVSYLRSSLWSTMSRYRSLVRMSRSSFTAKAIVNRSS